MFKKLTLIISILSSSAVSVQSQVAEKQEAKKFEQIQPSKCDAHYLRKVKAFEAANKNAPKGGVVLLGDSLTEGFPVNRVPKEWKLVGRGISGDCIGGWKYRGLLDRLDVSCFQLKPKQVFILIGINDTISWKDELKWKESPQSAPMKDWVEGYKKVIRKIRKNNVQTRIVLCSLLPTAYKRNYGKYNKEVLERNAKLKEVARVMKVEYADFHKAFLKEDGSAMKDEYSRDGVHLTKKGYDVWIEELKKRIDTK